MVTAFPDEPQRIVGGVMGAAMYLADELAKRPDLDLTVVVPQGAAGSEIALEKWGAVRVCRLPRRGFWKFLPGSVYDVFAGRAQISRLIGEIKPDIVHFQGAAYLSSSCEAAHVLTTHGIVELDAAWDTRWGVFRGLKRLVVKTAENYGRRRTAHLILISDSVSAVFPPHAGRRIWRIDNPIADSYFDVVREAEPGRIFCCSRITPLKNVAGMIDAFAGVARRTPRCQLRIAGDADPKYFDACARRAEGHGLRSSVRFLGSLSVREVQDELSRADCFATASLQEVAPLAIAEAMAVGVPVVAGRVGGVPEMVEHGGTGLLADPRDPRALGDAIVRVLSDERLARSMGARAKRVARGRFMASAVARKTVAAYREIIADGARAEGSA